MQKVWKLFFLAIASILVACGGGGGSGGESNLQYRITLRADKTQLPLNVGGYGAGIGVNAPYTTALYVEARTGGLPIPGGVDNIFGCNIAQDLGSGSLYYLDGDSDHEDDDGNPLAYRSVTLGANSGGATFHFHSGNQSGTARIVCSVTDPRDSKVYSASVDIVVGAATGMPSSVIGVLQAPRFLGSRDNTNLVRNNVTIQAFIMDDANQPIPNPAAPNLQVSIRPVTDAAVGARLVSGTQSGSVLQVRTINGIGLISLSSGVNTGAILLEYVTDRFDNNITNGIQDPVMSLHSVAVVNGVGLVPLSLGTLSDLETTNNLPFAFALSAQGGVPPYTWSAVGLPAGLTISSDGIIGGAPQTVAGDYNAVVSVTDAVGIKVSGNVKISVAAGVSTLPGLTLTSGSVLPLATVGEPYLYTFSATGGDPAQPIVWTFSPAVIPGGLVGGSTGNNAVISGTPTASCKSSFLVTATRGTQTVTQQVSVQIGGNTAACR